MVAEAERDRRVYLAGPDVFLPAAHAVLARKQAVCAAHGLVGVSPFDNEATATQSAVSPARAVARSIYSANRALMDGVGWCIANASPFRGVSIDPGTAFEVGYLVSRGVTVFAYSSDPRDHASRVEAARETNPLIAAAAGEGWLVEDFGLPENLMLPFAVEESGGAFLVAEREGADELFERCVLMIAERLV